jgi:hypothetical protein
MDHGMIKQAYAQGAYQALIESGYRENVAEKIALDMCKEALSDTLLRQVLSKRMAQSAEGLQLGTRAGAEELAARGLHSLESSPRVTRRLLERPEDVIPDLLNDPREMESLVRGLRRRAPSIQRQAAQIRATPTREIPSNFI